MERIGDVERSVSMTFVHGSHSWIDNRTGYEVKYIRNNSFVDVQVFSLLSALAYGDCIEFICAIQKTYV